MVDSALEKGRELPDWYLDEPQLLSDDAFLLQAFFELSTCRHYYQGAFGPIPWSAIVAFTDRLGLSSHGAGYFTKIIRILDRSWSKWQAAEIEKRVSARK